MENDNSTQQLCDLTNNNKCINITDLKILHIKKLVLTSISSFADILKK